MLSLGPARLRIRSRAADSTEEEKVVNNVSCIIHVRPCFTICVMMGIVGLTLSGGAESAPSSISLIISATCGSLLIALGLRSLFNAPDPDAQPPGGWKW